MKEFLQGAWLSFYFNCHVKDGSKKRAGEKFGKRLKQVREYLDMSQEKLATACDKRPEYISQVERGLYDVRRSTEETLIEGLGIKEKEFYDYEYLPPKPKKKNSSK